SWVDGDMAAIHDHGYTQWGAVQLFGRAEHAIFKQMNGVLVTAERRVFEPGDVVAVGHDLIHQMGNAGEEPYLSMHLYGCYGRHGDVTADARLYELDQGDIQITNGGVFLALPESAISRREDGPRADFPTTLRYRVELLKRLLRMHDSRAAGSFRSDRERRLAGELFAPRTWEAARRELTDKRVGDLPHHQRYAEVFGQEVAAAARLQLDLMAAGRVESELADERGRLEDLLAENDRTAFVDGYLELVDEAFTVAV
ncbi:MAG: hypothetical protein V3T72_11960, partial [Thermoanaerobaculia bacterium]